MKTMKSLLSAILISLTASTAAVAAAPDVTVKQIGATFLEAPPGRDKNLTPFGTFGNQESVETHAVVIFKDRLIADIPAFGSDDSKLTAMAILPNKSQVSLGPVKTSSFRKVSEDGKKTLVSISVSRLPDGGVSGVAFSGYIKLPVATSIARSSVAFQPKVGTKVDVGLGNSVISNIDSTSITLSGDERLMGIAGMKIIKADGSTITAERGGYSREGRTEGTAVSAQWRFSGPISAGKLEVSSYRDLTTIEVPINLIVAKPYKLESGGHRAAWPRMKPDVQPNKIVVLSGSGLSAESGLPTFRDSNGLWNQYSWQEVASPEGWKARPEAVLAFYNERRAKAAHAVPNAAHEAIAALDDAYEVVVITQNVDDLHERAGSRQVIHLHGELAYARGTSSVPKRYRIGAAPITLGQLCEDGTQLRPDIVWFGEAVQHMEEARQHVASAARVLVVGTSLTVYPAASLVKAARGRAEKVLNVLDMERVPFGFTFMRGNATSVVPALVEKWLGQASR